MQVARVISGSQRVLIKDTHLTVRQIKKLGALPYTLLLHGDKLSSALIAFLSARQKEKILFLAVGEGGKTVADSLEENGIRREFGNSFKAVPAHAKTWQRDGDAVRVTTSRLDGPTVDTSIRSVIALDDVVSTGETLQVLAERNRWRFPRAEWHAAVWITRKENLIGYKDVHASVFVTHSSGRRVPINSLSTLLADADLAADYAERQFGEKAARFLQALEH